LKLPGPEKPSEALRRAQDRPQVEGLGGCRPPDQKALKDILDTGWARSIRDPDDGPACGPSLRSLRLEFPDLKWS